MKRFLFFLLLLCAGSLFAQVDSVQLRVTYQSKYVEALKQNNKSLDVYRHSDTTAVDIGYSVVHSYSLNRIEYNRQRDSVERVSNDFYETINFYINRGKYMGSSLSVWFNYPKVGELTSSDALLNTYNYHYEEPIQMPEWKLKAQDSVVLGYNCSLAETDFRGRHWRVWYSLEIPYSYGPWQLQGLPGMILKAEESEGYFSYTCIGVEDKSSENLPVVCDLSNSEKLSRQDFRRLFRDYWFDQVKVGNRLAGTPDTPSSYHPHLKAVFLDKAD